MREDLPALVVAGLCGARGGCRHGKVNDERIDARRRRDDACRQLQVVGQRAVVGDHVGAEPFENGAQRGAHENVRLRDQDALAGEVAELHQ